MIKTKNEKILISVLEKMKEVKGGIDEVCPISIIDINSWEWAQGVGLYGIWKLYRTTQNKEHLEYLLNWFDRHIGKEKIEKNINTTAPMLTLIYLAEELGRDDYLKFCREWAEAVYKDFPRTEENGFQHIVSGEENYNQLWADTLFMTVLFLAKAGIVFGRNEYLEDAEYQFMLHIKYLHDSKTGLWYHGWSFNGRNNFANALWGRGNCWYTIGVVEFIEMVNPPKLLRDYLVAALVAQVEALKEYQDEGGGWHTLIDDADSYLEVSATAGFAAGILKGIKLGLLDNKYSGMAEKAVSFVEQNIDMDGTVLNVSYGTGMGSSFKHYKEIPICPMTYGQALAILCLIERYMY